MTKMNKFNINCWLICLAMVMFSCMENNSVPQNDGMSKTSDSLIYKSTDVISQYAKDSLPEYLFDIWGTPHFVDLNVTLNQDGSFVFNDCDKKGKMVVREGSFEYKNGNVILHYKDGSSLNLICHEELGTYYLYTKNKNHYFVKGLKATSSEDEDSLIDKVFGTDM